MKKYNINNQDTKKYKKLEKIASNNKPIISLFNNPVIPAILYPIDRSEAEIQALLWNKLKKKGYDARLEVVAISDKTNNIDNTKKIRDKFDIVIFNKIKKPYCIIEVKKKSIDNKNKNINYHKKSQEHKQAEKYGKYCLQVFYCIGMDMVDLTVTRVYRMTRDLSIKEMKTRAK